MMVDLSPVVLAVTYAYLAAFVGCMAAIMLRLWWGRTRALSSSQAAICALMPLGAIVVTVTASVIPYGVEPSQFIHDGWHSLSNSFIAVPALHTSLHYANLFVIALAFVGMARLAFFLAQQNALMVKLRELVVERTYWQDQTVNRLPSERPLCFTIGVLRPHIYVATGLLESLTDAQREAVVAHESAHIRRRDNVVYALTTALCLVFPLPCGAILCREWRRAAERACDLEAARVIGNPSAVAETIVSVARLGLRSPIPDTLGFASADDIEGRVSALLALKSSELNDCSPRSPLPLLAVLSAIIYLFFALEPALRHLIESFVLH